MIKKKNFILLLCLFSFVAAIFGGTLKAFAFSPDSAVSWGVTPNKTHSTPTAPGIKLLEEYGGLFVNRKDEKENAKTVYFTFDLGYEAGHTAEVLDILKENGIKAVFFLCGNYLKESELVGRMLAEGHSIGNHTDRHKDLPTLSKDAIDKDIGDFTDKFKAQYPQAAEIKFFRPPQGRFSQKVLEAAQSRNLHTMLWSIAIVDWGKTPIDAQKNTDKIARRTHNGAIILFHITNSGTPKMLRLLIPRLTKEGYSIGSPDNL